VEICAALEQWLAPYRGIEGKVATKTLSGYTKAFIKLRKSLKIPPTAPQWMRHGLRHLPFRVARQRKPKLGMRETHRR